MTNKDALTAAFSLALLGVQIEKLILRETGFTR